MIGEAIKMSKSGVKSIDLDENTIYFCPNVG